MNRTAIARKSLEQRRLGRSKAYRKRRVEMNEASAKASAKETDDEKQEDCEDSDEDSAPPESSSGAPVRGAAAAAALTSGKKSNFIVCQDSQGKVIDLGSLEAALSCMKQFMEACKTYEKSNSQKRKGVALRVIVDVGHKIWKTLPNFINLFLTEKSTIAAEFFTNVALTNRFPAAEKHSKISAGVYDAKKVMKNCASQTEEEEEEDACQQEENSTCVLTTSATQTKKKDTTSKIIADLQSDVSSLKDKLFQSINSSDAEIGELQAELEKAKNQVEELEEQVKKSKVSKKEIQRLRSSLGEAESKIEQNEKAKEQLKNDKTRFERETFMAREAARRKVLGAQMASLRSACQMEAQATDSYILGLEHLLRYAQLPLPTASARQIRQHIDLCTNFKLGLEDFLIRCEERCKEGQESSDCHELWDYCQPFASKRPTLPSVTLEALVPVVSALVKDAVVDNISRHKQPIVNIMPSPPPGYGNASRQQSHRDLGRVSKTYQELVSQIRKALPRLSSEECLHYLSCLKQNNDGTLSGLPIPYIIRAIASQLPAEAGEEEYFRFVERPVYTANALPVPPLGQRWQVVAPPSQQHSRKMSDDDEESNNPDECCICLGLLIDDGTTMTLPTCGHEFHGICIQEWLKEKRDCPICRKFVLTVQPDEYPELH